MTGLYDNAMEIDGLTPLRPIEDLVPRSIPLPGLVSITAPYSATFPRPPPTQTSGILHLTMDLIVCLWPDTRLVIGTQVCRLFRQKLITLGSTVTLIGRGRDKGLRSPLGPTTFTFHTLTPAHLRIEWQRISRQQLHCLARTLLEAPCPHIISLRLCGEISNDGLFALSRGIGRLTQLTTLDLGERPRDQASRHTGWWQPEASLRFHPSGRDDLRVQGARCLSVTLHFLPNLRELNLSHHALGLPGAIALANGLSCLGQLHTFDIRNNRISDAGLEALIPTFSTTLTSLAVGDNDIEEAIFDLRTYARRFNLQTFSTQGNFGSLVEIVLVHALIESIQHWPRLTCLELQQTGITDRGVVALTDGLTQGHLVSLNIGSSDMSGIGIHHLARLASRLTSLTTLILDETTDGEDGANHWRHWLGTDAVNLRTLSWSGVSITRSGMTDPDGLADALRSCP